MLKGRGGASKLKEEKGGGSMGERRFHMDASSRARKASIIPPERAAVYPWAKEAILDMPCPLLHSPGHLHLPPGVLTSPSHTKPSVLLWKFHNVPAKLESGQFSFASAHPHFCTPVQATILPRQLWRYFWLRRAFPALCQMNRWGVDQRNEWVCVGAAWGASASVRLDYREVGGLRSSVPSRSLWLAFYRLPVSPEMNQRVGVTRWFSFRWMVYCIICRYKKIINF